MYKIFLKKLYQFLIDIGNYHVLCKRINQELVKKKKILTENIMDGCFYHFHFPFHFEWTFCKKSMFGMSINSNWGAVMTVIVWKLDLQLPVQSVPKVVSSNPVHGEVYSIQHYVIKFVSDLRQVGGFLHQ